MAESQLKRDLERLSSVLTDLHKELIEIQFRTYEKAQGRIQHSGTKLDLLLNHKDFQWLRPLSVFIASIDHALGQDKIHIDEVKNTLKDIELLLFSDQDKTFSSFYKPYEPEHPSVIMLHQDIKKALGTIALKHLDS